MRVACVVLFATSMSLSPLFPLGLDSDDVHDHAEAAGAPKPTLAQVVPEATRPVLDVSAARQDGYAPLLGCVSGQQEGAMGVHYVNGDLVDEIVPVAAWHAHNHKQPPTLMGQVFTYNGSPNRYGLDPFYALHVWAWRDNPHGTFVDFSPLVSCDGFVPAP